MNDDTSGNTSNAEPGTDWEGLRRMTDAKVRAAMTADPDIAPTNEAFWEGAEVVQPQPREAVTMHLDADLLAWFRKERSYEARINSILRAYMTAQDRR